MQPEGLAPHAIPPGSLALIPFGNQDVGIPGLFIATAAAGQKILIIHNKTLPNLEAQLEAQMQITLFMLPIDNTRKTLIPELNAEISQTRSFISATPQTLTYGKRAAHQ